MHHAVPHRLEIFRSSHRFDPAQHPNETASWLTRIDVFTHNFAGVSDFRRKPTAAFSGPIDFSRNRANQSGRAFEKGEFETRRTAVERENELRGCRRYH